MDISKDYLKTLLEAYLEETISRNEMQELWRMIGEYQGDLQELLSEADRERFVLSLGRDRQLKDLASERMHDRLLTKIRQQELVRLPNRYNRFRWVLSAAAILLVVVAGVYFQSTNKSIDKGTELAIVSNDVAPPSSNQAFITLSDGSRVALNDLENGVIADQGLVKVVKNKNGEIVYQSTGLSASGASGLNTLSNPRGSKLIEMSLSDGSRIWLNSGSSITYPVQFTGKERTVSMEGEAFFDVVPDATKPFIVKNGNTAVTVLGTQFNVNAYTDEEDIKVSLLEGSVKINTAEQNSLLKPGEQARIGDAISIAKQVDMDNVMAWKNGLFSFDQAGLRSIMRTVARWYNIEVVYEGKFSDEKYEGQISMDTKLSEVLELLELNNIGYEIENNIVKLKSMK